ncbi:MAG TPA: IS21 family transposase [Candidatus Limnocylindrales bacterium]|nr:IS21 family transposase [Candidatus Limnocylindrales bacterium]
MRKTREILRLRWHLGQSVRATSRSCGVAGSTILELESRAKAAGLSWPLADDLDDAALEALLYKREAAPPARELPDFASVHRELRRKGVTLELLWLEYKERGGPQAYSYSRFCELYGKWRGTLDVVMRQSHRAGEKLFVDWAGQALPLTNAQTGEVTEQPIFVAALGASNYTYAEAAQSQESACWLMAHVRAFEFLGGVTEVVVPDNLKTGVTKACFYEPSLNKAYVELAEHYGTTILPTRVAKPKDKPKVENAVQQVERWVLAPLRNHTFFSLAEMNAAIAERLAWLNDRPFSRLQGTRRSLYMELDRPALRPLPAKRFEPADWKVDVGVGIDHHIVFDKHYYSVPHELVGKRVDVRAGFLIVELFYSCPATPSLAH